MKYCMDCGKPISPRAQRCGSCASNRRWEDPAYAKRVCEHLKSNDAIDSRRLATVEYYSNPQHRKEASAMRKECCRMR